jgi:hypothetical protein
LLAGQKVGYASAPVVAPAVNTAATASAVVKLEDVKNSIGKTVTVTGKVFSSRDIGSMILMNLGDA